MKFFSHHYQRRRIQAAAPRARGVLLDVGCAKKPYESVFRPFVQQYWGGDYPPGAQERRVPSQMIDVWLDGHRLPFASESVDTVVSLNVLEHVASPDTVLSEMARVLRPGGVAIVNLPFLYPIHGTVDYFRFTSHGLQFMLDENGLSDAVDIAGYGGFWAFFAQNFNHYIQHGLFRSNLFLYRILVLARPLFWFLAAMVNLPGLLFDKLNCDRRYSLGYVVIASKYRAERKDD
jgi:SAM-dependent methyltransferase